MAALYAILSLLTLLCTDDPEHLAARCSRAAGSTGRGLRWVARRGRSAVATPPPADACARLRAIMAVVGAPLVLLLLARPLAAASGLLRSPGAGLPTRPLGWALPIGAGATFLLADLALRLRPVARWRAWHGWAAVLVPAAFLNLLYVSPKAEGLITAPMAIALLCALVALVVFATHGRPLTRLGLIAAVVAAMAVTNNDPYKLTYPGLDAYQGSRAVALKTSAAGWHINDPAGDQLLGDEAVRQIVTGWESGVSSPSPATLAQASRVATEVTSRYGPHRLALNVRAYCGLMRLDAAKGLDLVPAELDAERGIALKALDDAIAGGDRNAIMLFHRGQLLNPDFLPKQRWPLVDAEEASRSYRASFEADPLLVRAGSRLAHLLESLKRQDEADRTYREAARSMVRMARAGLADNLSGPFPRAPAGPTPFVPLLYPPLKSQLEPDHGGGLRPVAASGGRQRTRVASLLAAPPIRPVAAPVASYVTVAGQEGVTANRRAIEQAKAGQVDPAIESFVEAFRAQPGPFAYAGMIESPSGLLNDFEVLDRWRLARADVSPTGPAAPKPALVVVAVSGGGIVAAGWTTRCLSAIESQYPDFPYHTRVITGASGGMVGAGLYVASLPAPGGAPRGEVDFDRLRRQVDADSLTPVIRRMIFRDLPSIFEPWRQSLDRGRVLEEVWRKNTGGALDERFADLRAGEVAGWRPSMIVSPLLVEDGAQMVISNLELGHLNGINLHFFSTFSKARDTLKLGTALRMNAAFPYVTPAVSLPTKPPRRVADAGYVDNYGIRLAAEWIRQHASWLRDHTSGVALVQIRAYKLDMPGHGDATTDSSDHGDDSSPIGTSLQWMTSPLEGYSMAKKAAMLSLNDNLVKALESEFDPAREVASLPKEEPLQSGRFQTFVFECRAEVPLSWMITEPDSKRLDEAIEDDGFKAERQRLVNFLQPKSDVRSGDEVPMTPPPHSHPVP